MRDTWHAGAFGTIGKQYRCFGQVPWELSSEIHEPFINSAACCAAWVSNSADISVCYDATQWEDFS